MNPLTKITGQRAALDYPIRVGANGQLHTIMFMFVLITAEIANDWLKANRKNRKLKEKTVTAYNIDMRNNAWLLTHQGIAFDEHGNLVDGQHRLMAILQSKQPVTMLVSFGWPTGDKRKTMDAVDRGVQRSLKDQLELQHGLKDAAFVATVTNQIAAACLGLTRVFKSTTDTTLAVFETFKDEIKWLAANPVRTVGLRQAAVFGCMAMGRAVWPERTAEFYAQLVTGANLGSGSPALHLRNYLLSNARAEAAELRCAVSYHLCAFAEGKSLKQMIVNSNYGLLKMLSFQKDRVEKIKDLYHQQDCPIPAAELPTIGNGDAVAECPENNSKVLPLSAAAIKIASTLSKRFTTLDLTARLDNKQSPGVWLVHWRNKGWIESAGPNEFVKTESFGK